MGPRIEPGIEPWKDQQWRHLACQYLGDTLAPIGEAPKDPELLKLEVENVKVMVPDLVEQNRRVSELLTTQFDRNRADYQWFGWYQALALWFPRPKPVGFTEYPFVAVVNAIVVAWIVVLVIARAHDWRLWLGSLGIFVICMMYEFVNALNYLRDTDGRYYQMAGMLRELEIRSTAMNSLRSCSLTMFTVGRATTLDYWRASGWRCNVFGFCVVHRILAVGFGAPNPSALWEKGRLS